MKAPPATPMVPVEQVERLIHLARGEKVLLDADLARLYGVETKSLNRAVKRNRSRFPQDFMFQLTSEEAGNLRRQIGTSGSGYGGRRYRPYAFTEQGVAMLSTYDVFLGRSAKDKAVVRPIAERLRKDGMKVGFDEWECPSYSA